MNRVEAEAFAAAWCVAWNAHEIDAVLVHFTDDVEFTSPLVPKITGGPNPIRGKAALRAYWSEGLRILPNLNFTIERIHVGVGVLAIGYRNERGRSVTEVLTIDDEGRASSGHALYGPEVS